MSAIFIAVLLLNLFTLGTSRINSVIRNVALQGAILGFTPLILHGHIEIRTVILVVVMVGVKGGVIPYMLTRAMRAVQIKREVEPIIGLLPSMILGAIGTGVAIVVARHLPLAGDAGGPLLVPASFATVFTGFLLLTTRIKAISQVLGYLLIENGIFIFGLLLLEAMPFLVEIGALLDLFVGVFVISIIIHHINREFSTLDTRKFSSLKD